MRIEWIALCGTGILPVFHGRDAHATGSVVGAAIEWVLRRACGIILPAFLLAGTVAAGVPLTARYVPAPPDRFATGVIEVAPVTREQAMGIRVAVDESGPDAGGVQSRDVATAIAWRDDSALILPRELPAFAGRDAMLAIAVPLDGGEAETVRLAVPSPARYRPDTDIFLLVDDSHSMRRTDPERLRVEAIRRFAERAAVWPHVRSLAIGSFTDRALLLLPLTPIDSLPPLTPVMDNLVSLGRTNIDIGMRMAVRALQQSPSPYKAVVLLSDGENTTGPYRDTHTVFRDLGWPVHAIGLSDEADMETLSRIARDTGGTLHEAVTAAELESVFAAVVEALKRPVLAMVHEFNAADGGLAIGGDAHLGSAHLTYVGQPGFDLSAVQEESGQRYTLRGGNVVRLRLGSGLNRWRLEPSPDGPGEALGMLRVEGASAVALLPFPAWVTSDGRVQCDVLLTGIEDLSEVQITLRADWPGGSHEAAMRDDGDPPDLHAGDGVFSGVLMLPFPPPDTLRFRIHGVFRDAAGQRIERVAEWHFAPGSGHRSARQPVRRIDAAYPYLMRVADSVAPALSVPVREPMAWRRELPGFAPPGPPWRPEDTRIADGGPAIDAPRSVPDAAVDVVAETPLARPPPPDAVPLRSLVPAGWRLPLAILLWCLLLALLVWWLSRFRSNRMTKYVAASVLAHVLLALLTLNFMIETGVVDLDEAVPSISVHIRAMEQGLGIEILPPVAPPVEVADAASRQAVERALDAEAVVEAALPPPVPVPEVDVRGIAVEAVPVPRAEPEAMPRETAARQQPSAVSEPSIDAAPPSIEPVVATRTSAPDTPRLQELPDRTAAAGPEAVAEAAQPPRVPITAAEARAVAMAEPVRVPRAEPEAMPRETAARQQPSAVSEPSIDAAPPSIEPVVATRTSAPDTPRLQELPDRTAAAGPGAVAEVAQPPRVPVAAAEARAVAMTEPVTVPRAEPETTARETAARQQPSAVSEPSIDAAPPAIEPVVATRTSAPDTPRLQQPPERSAAAGPEAVAEAAQPPRVPIMAAEARAVAMTEPVTAPRAAPETTPRETAARRQPSVVSEPSIDAAPTAIEPVVATRETSPDAPRLQRPRERSAITGPAGVATDRLMPLETVHVPGPAGPAQALASAMHDLPATPASPSADALTREPRPPDARTVVPPVDTDVRDVFTVPDLPEGRRFDVGTAHEAPSQVAANRAAALALPPPDRPALPVAAARPAASPVAQASLPPPRAAATPGVELDRRTAEIGIRAGRGRTTGSYTVDIPLARYGGDWDTAPTAMLFLAHNLTERTGLALDASSRVVGLDSPDLHRMPFVYMTGHLDFRFTDAEVDNLRRYLEGGGHLWADDSTHFGDETFDRAFRREIQRVLPGRPIERLGPDFEAFQTGYDLTAGYKGYAIPPGDKYRLDYLEGMRIGNRVAVVYSRNDYGDGLEIDPNTHPIMESLTDLSPREMQEGALRMGINLVLYFLAGSGRGPEAMSAVTAGLDTGVDASAEPMPTGSMRSLVAFENAAAWHVEAWADPATLGGDTRALHVAFQRGEHGKVALARELPERLALAPEGVLVVEAANRMSGGARLALGFHAAGRYFETRPAFLKPGDNTAIFPLDDTQFKTEATDWEFRDRLPPDAATDAVTVLIYSPQGGTVTLRDLRLLIRDE